MVIFSGSSSNNELSYDVEDGGRLLVHDIWYETNEFPRFMQCRGSGSFTLNGAMIATAQKAGIPAFEFDDYQGQSDVSDQHPAQQLPERAHRDEGPRGEHERAAAGRFKLGIGNGYLTNDSSAAHVALLQSMQYTQGGGGTPVPDMGKADPDFLRRMLAQTRSAKPKPLTTVPPEATDVRLYRVGVSNAQIGVHLTP